jgi:hypothetical protein
MPLRTAPLKGGETRYPNGLPLWHAACHLARSRRVKTRAKQTDKQINDRSPRKNRMYLGPRRQQS